MEMGKAEQEAGVVGLVGGENGVPLTFSTDRRAITPQWPVSFRPLPGGLQKYVMPVMEENR